MRKRRPLFSRWRQLKKKLLRVPPMKMVSMSRSLVTLSKKFVEKLLSSSKST